MQELIRTFSSEDFGTSFYQKLKFAEYLLLLNRYLLKQENQKISLILPTANPQILQILDYINAHLTQDLSIDKIADAAFLNRSYLMHLFRDETGYTIGKYITEKRLYLANHAIRADFATIQPSTRRIETNITNLQSRHENNLICCHLHFALFFPFPHLIDIIGN